MHRKFVSLLFAMSTYFIHTAANASDAHAVPPSKDPWYTLPDGADCSHVTSRGTVLRFRPAPRATIQSMTSIESAWNIMYCTTDSHMQPSFAVTTVLMPKDADRTSLVTYQVAYDSANIDDSPSYSINLLQKCPTDQNTILPLFIDKRWVVNLPDYEGPEASFTSGHASGYATLDSTRAVLSLKARLGIDQNVSYAMHGYSGGALATEWAAELQPTYAPELKFVGATLGGVPCKVTDAFALVNGKDPAALVVMALLGLSTQHPVFNTTMRDSLKHFGTYNATGFLAGFDYSLSQAAVTYQNQNIEEYFEDGLHWLQEPAIQGILDVDTIMGKNSVPKIPLFVYQAVGDEMAPVGNTDALVHQYRESGAWIEYTRNAAGDHNAEGFVGGIKAVDWLTRQFQKPPLTRFAYNTTNVVTPLNDCIRARYTSVWKKHGLPVELLSKKF